MTLILPKTCAMGGSKTGLVGTIGVTLLNPDGTTHTARATASIYEIGGGCYGKEIVFPDNWSGSLKWDTGGGTPVYAVEEYVIEGLLDMIEEDTSKMNFIGDDIKATLDGETVTLNAATEAQLNTIEEEVKRTLGLVHENIYIDLPGYDTNKNLVSARLRTYLVSGSVGTANDVIATYTITAVGAGKGKFTSWKMVKQ